MLPFVSASLHFQQGALGGDQDGNQVFPGIRLAQRKPQEMFQWINSLKEEVGKSVQLKTLGVQHSSDLRFPKAHSYMTDAPGLKIELRLIQPS